MRGAQPFRQSSIAPSIVSAYLLPNTTHKSTGTGSSRRKRNSEMALWVECISNLKVCRLRYSQLGIGANASSQNPKSLGMWFGSNETSDQSPNPLPRRVSSLLVCSGRLVVQDIALSRRRSRVRLPSGVPISPYWRAMESNKAKIVREQVAGYAAASAFQLEEKRQRTPQERLRLAQTFLGRLVTMDRLPARDEKQSVYATWQVLRERWLERNSKP